jgi:predicted dinucleotide-binding enzyme
MTTTAIIGLGNMGKGLARRLAGKTDLVLGSRDPAAASAFAATLPGTVAVLDQDAAIKRADIVILALPFEAALSAAANPALNGKILVDITNPLKPDFSGLTIGHTTSAGEQIQAAASGARVVKAYNTIFASLFDRAAEQTAHVPVFLAGNDAAAVAVVADLVKLSGFAVEQTGTLDAARLIEPLGMLNVRLAYGLGQGTSISPGWLRLAA